MTLNQEQQAAFEEQKQAIRAVELRDLEQLTKHQEFLLGEIRHERELREQWQAQHARQDEWAKNLIAMHNQISFMITSGVVLAIGTVLLLLTHYWK